LIATVRRFSIVATVVVLAAACGNDGRDSLSRARDPTGTGTSPAAPIPGRTARAPAVREPPPLERPLSSAERRRLVSIAGSIERAIALFDDSVRTCARATRGGCVDRAWSVLVVDLDWPPYYLRRFNSSTRGCELLAVAVQGVMSFVLGARQVDYGDPGDYATPALRREYLALVDGLRPVPDDLRAAAISRCRSR
jgi:hypothetical protein